MPAPDQVTPSPAAPAVATGTAPASVEPYRPPAAAPEAGAPTPALEACFQLGRQAAQDAPPLTDAQRREAVRLLYPAIAGAADLQQRTA